MELLLLLFAIGLVAFFARQFRSRPQTPPSPQRPLGNAETDHKPHTSTAHKPAPKWKGKRKQHINYQENPYKLCAKSEAHVHRFLSQAPQAQVLEVIDGDSVIVSIGRDIVEIRLDSIDCPEGKQAWGNTAKAGLIKIIGGKTIYLEQHGQDHFRRTLATLYVRQAFDNTWTNVNERMVMLGHAWVMRKYYDHLPAERQRKLNRLQQWARTKRVGLWKQTNPMPPWLWRKQNPDGGVQGNGRDC